MKARLGLGVCGETAYAVTSLSRRGFRLRPEDSEVSFQSLPPGTSASPPPPPTNRTRCIPMRPVVTFTRTARARIGVVP